MTKVMVYFVVGLPEEDNVISKNQVGNGGGSSGYGKRGLSSRGTTAKIRV